MILKLGSTGETVRSVQEILNFLGFRYCVQNAAGEDAYLPLETTGVFDAATESAVLDFQGESGILMDGVIGSVSFEALEEAYLLRTISLQSPGPDSVTNQPECLGFDRVEADLEGDASHRVWLRSDIAERYRKVYAELHQRGARLVTWDGKRALASAASADKRSMSMHYTGRAIDLFTYSGMVNPATDPYVITREQPRVYRVFARCAAGQGRVTQLENVMTYRNRKGELTVNGDFIDLTALFQAQDFHPSAARPRFEQGGALQGAEWWHFQCNVGLIPGVSTFGSELLRVYAQATLEQLDLWKYRDRIYGVNWS